MSKRYKESNDVPTEVLCARLSELANAIADGNRDELTMRIPAEPDRDADLVMSEAARRLRASTASPEIAKQEMRDAFEAWYSEGGEWPMAVDRDGESYVYAGAKSAWRVWQAAWRRACQFYAEHQGISARPLQSRLPDPESFVSAFLGATGGRS